MALSKHRQVVGHSDPSGLLICRLVTDVVPTTGTTHIQINHMTDATIDCDMARTKGKTAVANFSINTECQRKTTVLIEQLPE
jgi:heme O synthase-like polyprenyltransferase